MIDKESILEEVTKMFKVNGIKPVTMDNISMDLKISKRTLYEIFKDKDDLVKQVLMSIKEKSNAKKKEIINKSDNVIEAMFEIAKLKLKNEVSEKTNPKVSEDLKKYHPAIYEEAVQKFSEEAYNMLFKLIERGKFENYFKKEIDTEILIYTLQKIASSIEKDSGIFLIKPPRAFHETLTLPYLRGISTQEGQALIDNYVKKLFK